MDREKRTLMIWTTAAAFTMEAVIVITSLTPLAKIGNGTRFGSIDMWVNLIWCGSFYFLPLIVYCMGVRAMKYVLAVFNGIWLIAFPVLLAVAAGSQRVWLHRDGRIYPSLLLMALACFTGLVVHIIWYPMCLIRRNR